MNGLWRFFCQKFPAYTLVRPNLRQTKHEDLFVSRKDAKTQRVFLGELSGSARVKMKI